jgi:acyl carrier protein
MNNIENKLTTILSDVLGFEVDENVSSKSSPEWDSLAHLQIVLEVESEFDVKFLSQEIPNLTSFDKFVEAIKKRKNED